MSMGHVRHRPWYRNAEFARTKTDQRGLVRSFRANVVNGSEDLRSAYFGERRSFIAMSAGVELQGHFRMSRPGMRTIFRQILNLKYAFELRHLIRVEVERPLREPADAFGEVLLAHDEFDLAARPLNERQFEPLIGCGTFNASECRGAIHRNHTSLVRPGLMRLRFSLNNLILCVLKWGVKR